MRKIAINGQPPAICKQNRTVVGKILSINSLKIRQETPIGESLSNLNSPSVDQSSRDIKIIRGEVHSGTNLQPSTASLDISEIEIAAFGIHRTRQSYISSPSDGCRFRIQSSIQRDIIVDIQALIENEFGIIPLKFDFAIDRDITIERDGFPPFTVNT